jgi:hypothetical protein
MVRASRRERWVRVAATTGAMTDLYFANAAPHRFLRLIGDRTAIESGTAMSDVLPQDPRR